MDSLTRAAGPDGMEGDNTYPLMHTGAEIDAAITGWYTAQTQADATAADIAEGKKAITSKGLVTGTMMGGGEVSIPDIPVPQNDQEMYFLITFEQEGGSANVTMQDYNTWDYATRNVSETFWSDPVSMKGSTTAKIGLYTYPGQPKAILVHITSNSSSTYWCVDITSDNSTCRVITSAANNKAQLYRQMIINVPTTADYRTAYNIVTGQDTYT